MSTRKCAIFSLFFFFQIPDRNLYLPDYHLANIAGCGTENRNRAVGVEVIDSTEIFSCEEAVGIIACAGQRHKRYAVLKQSAQPCLQIEIVQFFQQAPIFDILELGKII